MRDLDEALDYELVRAREMVVELDQPGAERPVRQLGVPVKLGRTPGGVQGPGPVLGEHTDEVLEGLGYPAGEIDALKESGAVAGPAAGDETRVSAAELRRSYDVSKEVLDRLAELGVLTPSSHGYGPSDVKIVEAISRFRAGGYDELIGFTVYDTLRYKRALEALVEEEVEVLMERLAGEMDADRAVALIDDGAEPLRDLIAALHQKLLVAELRRQRAARG